MRKSFTVNGKRYEVYGKTQKEIDDKYFHKRLELENQSELKFRELCERWLSIKENNIEPKNYRMYESDIEHHLSSILDKSVTMITFDDCQEIVSSLSGYSEYSIRKKTMMLKSILGLAVKSGILQTNPAEFVIKPSGNTSKRRSLECEEKYNIICGIKQHPHGLYFELMLYCGLRPYECSYIQGKDIEDSLLHVRGTKTKNADRYVLIPNGLCFPDLADDEYLFPNLTEKKRQRWWKALKRLCEIPEDITPYCLRHTYCTDLERLGIPLNIARQMMGHSDIRLTSEIYTHTSKIFLKNFSEALKTLVL